MLCTPQVTNEKMSSSPLLMFSSFGRRWAVIISHLVHALAAAYYEMMIELWKVYNFVHPICSKAKLQSIKQAKGNGKLFPVQIHVESKPHDHLKKTHST